MASYTTSLRLVQPATGEYSGTWGTQVNTGLTALVDTSVAGTASITMTAANYTLSSANGASDEARAMFLALGGTPGASYQVICPAVSKLYFVTNNTGFAQTVKTSAGSGVSVPNGASMTLRCNGTDVVEALSYFGSMTLANPSINNYTEGVVAIGTVTTSHALSLTSGTVQTATLTASTACTFTMPTATAGKSFVLLLKQAAATGNGTATFTGVKWPSVGAPIITPTAGRMDILTFVADGTNWYGSYTQGYTP